MPSVLRAALGLALASALLPVGRAAAQPAQPTVIKVQLLDYKYDPKEIDLDQGHTYVLRLTEPGFRVHNLEAKAFFQTVTLAPQSAALVRDGAVEVYPGWTVDVVLTPHTPGTYEMHSSHAMNELLGMKGQIVVR